MAEIKPLSTKTEFISPETKDDLPEAFQLFWEDWYAMSKEQAAHLPQLLLLLEKLLFECPDEIITHQIASEICRALRFWRLQIERKQPPVNLKTLVNTWELFQSNFIPRVPEHKSTLIKAFAVLYSFAGLAIIKNIDKGILQKQSAISFVSAAQENSVEHSWGIDLLTAKFQKTVGYLTQAEDILQGLAKKLQQSAHNAIYGSALFELCDIYIQMARTDKTELLHSIVRRLFLQNPSAWDFTLVGSHFCNDLLQKLPPEVHKQFAPDDPVALNWAGLYALANKEYGTGAPLSHQMQKNYWAQILQLKKAISDQRIAASSDFYSLQRVQLLIYYILILEHLSLVRQVEKSPEVLEKNSLLWHDVMIEIYSLSEDISQRCKHRFS